MSFMLRMALYLLLGFALFMVCVQGVIIAAMELLWPHADGSGPLKWYGLGVAGFCFLLTLLLLGWYLGRPIYYMVVWIRQLALGHYEKPENWNDILSSKNKNLKRPYVLYKELFDHLSTLANTLQENRREKLKSEQVKKEWIRGIAHDLKTPLTYISGYSAMLLHADYRWTDAERNQFLTIIGQKSVQIQELVQDLNDTVHTKIPLHVEEADLVELVRRLAADVGSAPWASGYSLTIESELPELRMRCDPRLLTRALRNLLVNAIVHNPEGTEITVHIRRGGDWTVEIGVADNGVGFIGNKAENEAEGASRERSGLGLSIARQLIEAHGGTLSITSRIQKGTSIWIHLPLANS